MSRKQYTTKVKAAAQGRWLDILENVAQIPRDRLDGNGHPCPLCGGDDRFSLLDESRGAVHCRNCFNKKNGDGISAVQHFMSKSFPEAVDSIGKFLAVEPPKAKPSKKQPEDYLKFSPNISEQVEYAFCQSRPGITPDGLKRCGARQANYKDFIVLAFPIIGETGDIDNPVGWVIGEYKGEELPKYDKNGKITGKTRWKLLYGSKPGLMGTDSIARMNIKGAVERVYKVEGVSDMLALASKYDDLEWPMVAVVTNSNGTNERPGWRSEYIARGGRTVFVIHDCDDPGQAGAKVWSQSIAAENKGVTRNVVLPYPIDPNKGKDLRDFFAEKSLGQFERVCLDAPDIKPPIDKDGILDPTKIENAMEKLILKKLRMDVLYEEESGRIRIFSEVLRKSTWIKEINRLSKPNLIQACGSIANYVISEDPEPPKTFSLKMVKEAIATIASGRRSSDSERGMGVWLGIDARGDEDGSVVLVQKDCLSRYNSDCALEEITQPRCGGLVTSLGEGCDWFKHDVLKEDLALAADPKWRQRTVAELKEIVSQWNWKNHEAATELVTGLILATPIQSIWDHRPIVSITGESNSGKSCFLQFLGGSGSSPGILGELAFKSSNSTEAGIRQLIGNTSRPIICDEFEAGPERTKILEKLFRPATRGDAVARGTTDHQGTAFDVRIIPWTAGTESGLTAQPDINRSVQLELYCPEKGKQGSLDLPQGPEIRRLAQKLLAVSVCGASESRELARSLQRTYVEGVDARVVESYSVPAACLAVAKGSGPEQATDWLLRLLKNVDPQEQGQKDQEQLLADILNAEIRDPPSIGTRTVAQLLKSCRGCKRDEPEASLLEAKGIKVLADGAIAVHHTTIGGKLLKGTRWESQKIDQLLLRLPGIKRCTSPRSIGGVKRQALEISRDLIYANAA